MNSKNDKKLEILFQYFKNNGFNKTIEDISTGINVTKKTIFNRYCNKENMELVIQNYWRFKFRRRFLKTCTYFDNVAEMLVFMIYELKKTAKEEACFFEREVKSNSFFNEDDTNSLISIIKKIINKGVELEFFSPYINVSQYSHFFIYNIVYLYILKNMKDDMVQFVLLPLITPKSMDILKELNLNFFFEVCDMNMQETFIQNFEKKIHVDNIEGSAGNNN